MVAVIKGDIIASRKLTDQEKWLSPLKKLLASWGDTPKEWELVWGDFFQLEVPNPQEALKIAFQIKALIKKIEPANTRKKAGPIDVRMAIGIGEKTFSGSKVSESNGPAFINAGNKFDTLKKENVTIGLKSPWNDFDDEVNLYLKLISTSMDKWTVSSAELVELVLKNPHITQEEIGKKLGIKQNSVSGRWSRAKAEDMLAVEKMYRSKIKRLLE